ncbi:MAG: Mrp/NBP35 family ATP-binding protein [Halalkalicoccus sp.]
MKSNHSSEADRADRVRDALIECEIGRDVLFAGLSDLDGIGSIDIDDHTAIVTITLPVPSAATRTLIEGEIRDAATHVDGVSTVDCRWAASAADRGERVDLIPDVKNLIAVASGKGGVGKSTVAVNLAVSLADAGARVGLLDADVYGPNAPQLLGLSERTPDATLEDRIVPREAHGVHVMSMGFIVGEDDPVIWRGPLVDDFIKQLFDDVDWGELDCLIVDLPPGTGDAQLSLVQHLPIAGAVIVTTPQPVAVDDARRGLRGFRRYDVPILGIVENMSSFSCSDCGASHEIFGTGGAAQLSEEFSIPVLGRIPLDGAAGTLSSSGEVSDQTGIAIPGFGRLGLPQTREEREGGTSLPPIALRENGGETRNAMTLTATRAAARINALGTSASSFMDHRTTNVE